MKRLTNATTYKFGRFAVTMERIKNTASGCPRWEVTITDTDKMDANGGAIAYRYRFNGHYLNEEKEALEAVAEHIKLMDGNN